MRAHLLGSSIRTILNQSFEDFELLIRDDCSRDVTEQVVRDFKDPRIKYHRNETNLGMPENLNQGIRAARGQFVVVCHDHDLYNWRMLEKMVSLLDEHPSVGMVHTGIAFIDQEDRRTGVKHISRWPTVSEGRNWLSFMLSSFNCPVCANAMVRRSVHEELGLYAPGFGFVADVEMWMRISLAYDIGYIAEPLIQVRERDGKASTGQALHWSILDAIIRIHKEYCQEFYRPPEAWLRKLSLKYRTEKYLLMHYLACLKNGLTRERLEGKKYLARHGWLACWLVAALL
jgi:glycosyltransferase involved in cell wall biosynthesis